MDSAEDRAIGEPCYIGGERAIRRQYLQVNICKELAILSGCVGKIEAKAPVSSDISDFSDWGPVETAGFVGM